MSTPGNLPTQPLQGSGLSGRNAADEARKGRAPIPKLVVKGGDPTTLTRTINEWIQRLQSVLTCSPRQLQHFGPRSSLLQDSATTGGCLCPLINEQLTSVCPLQDKPIPHQLPLLEATMRAELISSAHPARIASSVMQNGATAILDLLFLTLQAHLPSEASCCHGSGWKPGATQTPILSEDAHILLGQQRQLFRYRSCTSVLNHPGQGTLHQCNECIIAPDDRGCSR